MNRFRSKNIFFEVFNDLSVFEGKNINYFRVLQSSLLSEYGTRQKKASNFFNHKKVSLIAYFTVKNLFIKGKPVSKNNANFLLEASPRLNLIGTEWKSPYIDKWIKKLEKKNCHIHFLDIQPNQQFEVDSTKKTLSNLKIDFDNFYWELFLELKTIIIKIEKLNKLSQTELENVITGFEFFYKDFVRYDSFYKKFKNLKKIFIYPAYQKEAIVLAANLNNIEVVELQHGIIGSDSRFYQYPKQVSLVKAKSLLPNKIYVWGDYWKNILLKGYEFEPNQIEVVGDFIFRKPVIKKEKQNVLLISVNKYMQEVFIPYIKKQLFFLNRNHNDWKILLKLHPGDKLNYMYVDEFQDKPFIDISKQTDTIEDCISIAKIQVSAFSMVIFEALDLVKANYIVNDFSSVTSDIDEFEGFQKEMVEEGIAKMINRDEDIITHYLTNKDLFLPKRDIVFKPFSKE